MQVTVVQEELSRVNILLTSRAREVDELRRRIAEQEITINGLRVFEVKIVECERNNSELRQRIE